jgi:tetratricopeptide (TPR) repeat protein
MDGDYAEGARLLGASRSEKYNDSGIGGPAAIFDGYTLPRAWYEGLIARGRGETDAAERAFAVAQRMVEADLAQWRDDAKTLALLGLLHAARGRKEEAVRAGQKAVELLPISKDAYDGPLMATKLAVIYAQVGELDLACELLADLVKAPNGPTAGTLRVEPEWEPLRGDPRFERLAARDR